MGEQDSNFESCQLSDRAGLIGIDTDQTFVNFHFPYSPDLPLTPSLILPLQPPVTSVQIKVEFSPCHSVYPIAIVNYDRLQSVFITLVPDFILIDTNFNL